MNLGQLIGELRMRAEGIEPRTEAPPPAAQAAQAPALGRRIWGKRNEQVLELAKTRATLTYRDVVEALAVKEGNAREVLRRLASEGKLARVSPGTYALPASVAA